MQPLMLHGQRGGTFVSPPLDAVMTLPEMYDWHERNSAQHPLFAFNDGLTHPSVITWGEAVLAMRRASKIIKTRAALLESNKDSDNPVIGVLASLDTITYFCLLVGIIRMGWTVFPLSPRNSAEVVAELLTKSNATYIIASSDHAMQNLAAASVKLLAHHGGDIQVLVAPTFGDLFPPQSDAEKLEGSEIANLSLDAPGAILHSSGTTGNPKPVTWTHRALRQFALHPCYGTLDLAGMVMSIHAMGMHHGIGMLQIAFVATTGLVLSTFKPHSPPTIPDPINVFEGAITTKSDFIYCAPTFVETWSRTQSFVDRLALFVGVVSSLLM